MLATLALFSGHDWSTFSGMWTRRVLVALIAVGLPACARACGKRSAAQDAGAASSHASGIEMLAEGKEPRLKLEVGRWAGLAYGLTLTGEVSMGVTGRPPVKSPRSVTSFEFEVLRGTANPIVKKQGGRQRRFVEERGVISRAEVQSAEVPQAALQSMNEALATLRGLTTRQLIGEDGEIAEVTTEALEGKELSKEVKEVLDRSFDAQRRFPFRLPPKAVGVGGKWRFRESVELSGVTMWQICEMSVTQIQGDRVTISLRVRHEAPKQDVPHPLFPEKRADVEQYRGDGTGHITIDRMTTIVTEGKLSTTGSLKLSWYEEDALKSATFLAATRTELSGRIGRLPEAGAGDASSLDAGVDAAGAAAQ
jgi:hypothetical protein